MVFEFLDQLFTVNVGGTEFTLTSFIFAAVFMIVGFIIARIARLIFDKKFAPNIPEHTVKNSRKLIYYGIILVTFLAVITSQGIDLSGLLVAGGIFGVVIGFATQSVVSNLISGFFLMIEKPTKQGDFVELPDMRITGTVVDLTTFSTRIRKPDGTIIRIPNDKVFTTNIRAISSSEARRLDTVVGISYNSDTDRAISVIKKAIEQKIPYVLIEPEPTFIVGELGDNSVNIQVLVWHHRDHWIKVKPILLKVIKKALDEAGIEIPFPQRVVHNVS